MRGARRDRTYTHTSSRFPIALHPARQHYYVPNDSGPVLTRPPNRRAPNLTRAAISARLPLSPSAPGFAGITRQATHGPRSSTKIFFRITRRATAASRRWLKTTTTGG